MDPQSRHPFLSEPVIWHFPLRKTHWGVPLGNGTFGALIWGGMDQVHITINRADYWEHRGGLTWGEEATYENLKGWLQQGDEAGLRRAFEGTHSGEDTDPPRPTRLPMGRIDLRLPPGSQLTTGSLDLATSEATFAGDGAGAFRAVLVRHDPILALNVSGADIDIAPRPPDADEVVEHFRRYGLPPAQVFEEGDWGGWVQECPGEPAMCVGWKRTVCDGMTQILITSVYGQEPASAREQLEDHAEAGYQQLADRTASWWAGHWSRVAAMSLPSRRDELLYYLGMYKLAGLSVPGGPAATLQGPWVEEYRMPPWSSDYHFNINVQECYWPAFGANFVSALEPLWDMLDSWRPRLKQNARIFAGVEDGLQLPHAVDDRCTSLGGFWTGFIDHGSTSWTGHLMWLRWRYTMDRDFLAQRAYPFLKGAMRVYEAMLEPDGDGWALPVSVSPEFRGAQFDAWGRNASFQLANIHFLCRALVQASELLGVDPEDRARWRQIDEGLPIGATDEQGRELWLWEGQPLSESHRHHSHLAGLYPLDVFDYHRSEHDKALIDASLHTLTARGTGLWSGWCVPWAAILHARTGNGDMADTLLDVFGRCFMNPGYATGHDARFPGFTLFTGRPEIMQIEAAMAAAAAVIELLVQCSHGIVRVFPAVPGTWRDVSFEGIRVEGAFLVSARMQDARPQIVEISSEAGGPLRMANPFADQRCMVRTDGGMETVVQAAVVRLDTRPGQRITLTAG